MSATLGHPDPLDVPPGPATPSQPSSGQRGSGFLTEPFRLGTTPSATVGPYLAIGLTWPDGVWAAAEGSAGGIWLRGRVFDGAGDVVPDAMIETWQADPDGRFPSPEDPRGAARFPGFRGYARTQTIDPLDVPDVTEPYQPLPGRSRSTGFLTEPLRLGTSPSATVGPYLAIGLSWPDGTWAADEGVENGIWIRGLILDGADQPVPDAMVESWQADPDGGFPSSEDPRGASSYPGFRGFARGLLDRVVTRIYFADEAAANAEDVVLRGLTEEQRRTLVAEPTDDGYRLDIHLQGEQETVFFAV